MKISIITATYNSAATVRDTIESILGQTYQDWELIIEDGLSKDDTLAIVREYEPRCNGRMHIYSEKDEGLYDAMNRGIARATGDIIGILNSDDFYHDERVLEDINRAMENQPVDCVYGDLKFVKASDTKRVVRIWRGSQHESGAFLRGWHPAHPTFYARRECFERLGVFDTSYAVSADFELMLRFIEVAGLRNRYLPRYFVKMRMGGESTGSLRNIIHGNQGILRALREHGFHPSKLWVMRRMLPKIKATIQGKLHLISE
ncbi:MAG: glycosyltransferase [Bacteroidaceae bacterium]|nr:glycosyltransferase [Bacteroidaceae bacterium]